MKTPDTSLFLGPLVWLWLAWSACSFQDDPLPFEPPADDAAQDATPDDDAAQDVTPDDDVAQDVTPDDAPHADVSDTDAPDMDAPDTDADAAQDLDADAAQDVDDADALTDAAQDVDADALTDAAQDVDDAAELDAAELDDADLDVADLDDADLDDADAGDGCEVANACGGCAPLLGEVGEACGRCGGGRLVCAGPEALVCEGDTTNACGGCGRFEVTPGTACNPCGNAWTCDPSDGERVTCAEPRCGLAGFALVQPGRYTRGSNTDSASPVSNTPAHEVEITRPFYIHTFEFTWNALAKDITPPELEARPARGLNWVQAVSILNQRSTLDNLPACYTLSGCTGSAFCHALDDRDCDPLLCEDVTFAGLDCRGWRLPTEAEWEYATRAGTTTELYSGDLAILDNNLCATSSNLDVAGWYCANSSNEPHTVAQKLPNPWGLYDTLGNVWEWTQDGYEDPSEAGYSPRQEFSQDPFREGARLRIVRGGSFPDTSLICTSATRQLLDPEVRYTNVGFRAVRRFVPVLESRR